MQEPVDLVLNIKSPDLPRMTKGQANNLTRTVVQNFGAYTITQTSAPEYIPLPSLASANSQSRTKEPLEEIEKQIHDLNIFMFYHHEKNEALGATGELHNKLAHHKYIKLSDIANPNVTIPKVRVGLYNIMVVANVGKDMSTEIGPDEDISDPLNIMPVVDNEDENGMPPQGLDLATLTTYSQLVNWRFQTSSPRYYNLNSITKRRLPMRYISQNYNADGTPTDLPGAGEPVLINHNPENATTHTITLTNLVAKVNFSYDCSGINAIDSKFKVRMYGVNNLSNYFAPFKMSGIDKDITYTDELQLFEAGTNLGAQGAKTFYVPANEAGFVPGLTPQKRTLATSPKKALYTTFTATCTVPGTSDVIDVAYPIFLGDANAVNPHSAAGAGATESLFENFDVKMGHKYNVNLKINKFDKDDPRLILAEIKPLFNGEEVAEFGHSQLVGGEIVYPPKLYIKTTYFVDILIEATGAHNQQLRAAGLYTLTGEEEEYFNQRIVELTQDANGKWLNEVIIDEPEVPSAEYAKKKEIIYKGKRLFFGDEDPTVPKIYRAFRFYFKYTRDVHPSDKMTYQFSVKNLYTGLTSEITPKDIYLEEKPVLKSKR